MPYIEPALRPELLHEQQVGDLELVVPVLRVLQVDEALLQAYLPCTWSASTLACTNKTRQTYMLSAYV